MKSSRIFALGAASISAALLLSACGKAPDTTASGPITEAEQSTAESETAPESSGDLKTCMVAGLGSLQDKSFNESAWEGFKRAEADFGVEIAVVETFADSDYEPAIQNFIGEGCDLIVGVSFMMTPQMDEAAAANPDVKFALVDDVFPSDLENAKGIVFDTAEASYLAGYAAAGVSTTEKVGTFLGGKMAPTMLFADGFVDGVLKYNEAHGADVEVIGWDKADQDGMATGDFEDVAKGKQFSQQLIQQGADVILPVAGKVSTGALAAAKEAGDTAVIWVDTDGYFSEPGYAEFILTSVMKQIGNAVYDTIGSMVDGEFTSDNYVGTLANEGVGLAPWHDFEDVVGEQLNREVEELRQQIIDGEIVVESPSAP